VGTVWTKAKDGAAATRLSDQIDGMFENSPYPTKTESEKAFQMGFVAMMGNIKLLVTSIGTIIVLVILLIAANTMAMAARERVTEIAVLRTLGFQKSTVLGLILGESLVLGVSGGLFGIALFSILEPGLKKGLLNSPMGLFAASMELFPDVLLVAFGVAVGVGLIAGIVPAIRSAQRSITDGLRQVA
jgi:putative ABC transport system permease protein